MHSGALTCWTLQHYMASLLGTGSCSPLVSNKGCLSGGWREQLLAGFPSSGMHDMRRVEVYACLPFAAPELDTEHAVCCACCECRAPFCPPKRACLHLRFSPGVNAAAAGQMTTVGQTMLCAANRGAQRGTPNQPWLQRLCSCQCIPLALARCTLNGGGVCSCCMSTIVSTV
jgi:hypothetical protein